MADDALVIFTPSGRRGRFADRDDRPRRGALARRRHRLGLRRARDLRPLPGDAGPRRVPEARDHVRARATCRRSPTSRRPTEPRRGWPPTGGCRAPPRSAATSSSTSRPRARSTARSCARASTSGLHGRPGRPAPLRRGHAARARLADRRPRPAVRGARARVAADRARGRPRRHPRAPAGARGRQVRGHRRGPRGARRHRHLAGPPRDGLRRRDRHRLDDDRRPPGQPGRRRGPRQQRRDEPADPLRRGPDEPRLVRDDASRGRRRDDRRPCARRSTG